MFTLKVYTGNSNIVIKVKHENENITRINNEVSKKISNANQSDLVAVFFLLALKNSFGCPGDVGSKAFFVNCNIKVKIFKGEDPL